MLSLSIILFQRLHNNEKAKYYSMKVLEKEPENGNA